MGRSSSRALYGCGLPRVTEKDIDKVVKNHRNYLRNSGLAKNVDKLLKDGWGGKLDITSNEEKTTILVTSDKYKKYIDDHKISKDRLLEDDDD